MKLTEEGSTNILKYFLEEGESRLQKKALDRAIKNKISIEEQTRKTVASLTLDRQYALYGKEVESEIMARNREQFEFRMFDLPKVPERKSGPGRIRAAFFMVYYGCCGFIRLHYNPRSEKPAGGIDISYCMESYASSPRLVA